MKHPPVVAVPQIWLCCSTWAEDLGRKLHVPHLQSQHLKLCLQVMKTRDEMSKELSAEAICIVILHWNYHKHFFHFDTIFVYWNEKKSLWCVAWTHHVQMAASRGLSKITRLADVKVYWKESKEKEVKRFVGGIMQHTMMRSRWYHWYAGWSSSAGQTVSHILTG